MNLTISYSFSLPLIYRWVASCADVSLKNTNFRNLAEYFNANNPKTVTISRNIRIIVLMRSNLRNTQSFILHSPYTYISLSRISLSSPGKKCSLLSSPSYVLFNGLNNLDASENWNSLTNGRTNDYQLFTFISIVEILGISMSVGVNIQCNIKP